VPQAKNQQIVSIAIIGALFFIFGFVTWLNGSLIPFLQLACDLPASQALLVTFAFYMAYFVLALPSSYILNWVGYKKGMSLGLAVMAGGALLFIPAANARNFSLFLVGLFIQAAGMALLQTASNPYIAVLGPMDSAARRIAIMGICNKLAGVVSPLILSAIVLKGASAVEAQIKAAANEATRTALMQELSERVIAPYVVIAAVLALLAVAILLAPLPEIQDAKEDVSDSRESASKTHIWQFPHLLLGAVCIFVYVGAEVMAGDVIGPYGKAMGMSLDQTKSFTSYTLASMVVGYIIGVVTIPRYLKQHTALQISAILGLIFTVLAFVTSGYVSILFIALLGLANALMWPAIWPLAIDGLGRFTQRGAALLIMGIAGGAIVPKLYGELAEVVPAGAAFFLCTLPCYVFILYYAINGHRVGRAAAVRSTAEGRVLADT
jgi:MFS transporter, FHS family, L-fucose permease